MTEGAGLGERAANGGHHIAQWLLGGAVDAIQVKELLAPLVG